MPAQNSPSGSTTPGPAQLGDERLPSELSAQKALSDAALESLSSNMGSVTSGNSVPSALSHAIRPEVETTSQAITQQSMAMPTAGTGGPLNLDSRDQPVFEPKSPESSTFVREEKSIASDPAHSLVTTTVDRGTSVEIRLADALSSDHNRAGDSFQALLATPLVANGTVLAGEGSTVFGRIADVRRARLLGGRGSLALTLASIKLPDGRLVQINTTRVQRSTAENPIIATTKIIGGAALGSVKGALNGAAHGAGFNPNTLRANPESSTGNTRAAVLAAGTEISFNLTSPVTLSTEASR